MMDDPEKESYKVMQTKTLLHSFTVSSWAGPSVGRRAHKPTSNLTAQHALRLSLLPSGDPPQLYFQSATLTQLNSNF